MMLSKVYQFLFLVVLFPLFSCGGDKKPEVKKPQQRPAPKVDVYVVKSEVFAENVQVPGSIVANEVTEIHPEVSGRVVSLNVREGQFVEKGTLLAKIYDGDLQAQLRKLQTQLAIANSNETRASQLLEIQGISKQDYDASLLTVKNIQADIDIIRTAIIKTEVRAPFSGKMGLKEISPGAYITPATVIATINQISTLKVDFSVPEKYTSQIRQGQIVNFTVEGNDRYYAARIVATESNVDVSNRSLMVRAVVNSGTQGLIPGTFAKVIINFAPRNNTIFIPSQSIVPTARGKQVILFNQGKTLFNDVELGIRDSSRVEITKGLKVGDTILVTGIMATKPDSKIELRKVVN